MKKNHSSYKWLISQLFAVALIPDYREIWRYGVAGVGTTAINISSFWFFSAIAGIYFMTANALAWLLSFLFAFATNKLWVFQSAGLRTRRSLYEFVGFLGVRLFTLLLDMVLIWLFIAVWHWANLLAKISDALIIIVLNYLLGKYLVFRAPRTKP
ncbi:MAG: GtrA family protein [Succinivibrio sp.]|nr:GtrA family protein [Succinivibrio sp.]